MARTARKTTQCECIAQVNEQLKEKNARLVQEMMVSFEAGTAKMSPPLLLVERIRNLRDGQKAPTLICAYCPFCGKKYRD